MFGPDLSLKGGISFVVREYLKAGLHRKVSLVIVSTTDGGGNSRKIKAFLGAILNSLKIFLTTDPGICHFHVSQNGSFYRKFILILIARLAGWKIVVQIHGSSYEAFLSRRMNFWLNKKSLDLADRVIVLSDRFRSRVESITQKAKVCKLYNPATTPEKINSDAFAQTINVLFLGKLSLRKGTYDLLQCIKEHHPYFVEKQVRFILAGDGDMPQVEAYVDHHRLKALVSIPGWVSGRTKKIYLSNADIYVLPSYNEQMPMSILEAMAYGLPIVSTHVAGIPEMVEDGYNGILIQPGDREALVSALKRLIESKDERILMGQNGSRRVAEKFAGEIIINHLMSIYARL